jgi:hypothetical protein
LLKNKPKDLYAAPSLFALTGQSNISNWKAPLGITAYASSLGYHVLLDAAALAPSTSFSLSDYPAIDAIAVSFYKMFGFPTGIGALVVKKKFLGRLKRPWFAGGTVDVVQVPGKGFTRAEHLYEQFEVRNTTSKLLPCLNDGTLPLTTCVGRYDQLHDASLDNRGTEIFINLPSIPPITAVVSSRLPHIIPLTTSA